jgi:threonine/homoserine/homoserine lactone efflux protein
VPHILGIIFGFCTLVVAAGLGLASLFATMPWLYEALKFISFVFLLYLAWKIGSAGRAKTKDKDKPLSFLQAASFQLINPKGVTVIITSVTAYSSTAENIARDVTILLLVFAFVALISTCTWTVFGIGFARLLTNQRRQRRFNITMAALLVASLLPVIIGPILMS